MIARLLMLIVPPVIVALYVFGLHQQRDEAKAAAQQATEQRDQLARQTTTLAADLAKERAAQAGLRATQDDLRAVLARRQSQLEDLKHENQELRDWAARPLPDAARRLLERPALTGADAYRERLPGGGAMPAVAEQPAQ
ncbi:phage lysis regulatory protein, LysB family [Azotobacter beijerinckii]|uniref:Phage lysis regulatory protein, LysB family n=1 Tax=Azotobacter beijerinckii TaxID=170623 RepID=A0A1I1A2W4_9GAMM|nr:Rz-like lysis system protein LysB [Azotobacter beijerinckii]SFB30743.1 phage lysis regulatory protein, LysB family [Azotobacter beijerinckii]